MNKRTAKSDLPSRHESLARYVVELCKAEGDLQYLKEAHLLLSNVGRNPNDVEGDRLYIREILSLRNALAKTREKFQREAIAEEIATLKAMHPDLSAHIPSVTHSRKDNL
ncbi:MAG TPA: hypothetical protein VGG19_12260 [Tepidisphaeraceae bacterium]|jgi:hypothetical protein